MEAFSFFGIEFTKKRLDILLPVGISFYTFQTLSYTIDVYKRNFSPTKNFWAFCAFVSFFPQLVAGPIERASNLLPQFYTKKSFDYTKAVDGLRRILWGFFKKIVIADNCAKFANLFFNMPENFSGSALFLGAIFFTFQIYGDFSGYSDIAIGTARLFGFELSTNFATPYFSRNIAEFWRRWHISLSSWFRDYIYIPLGGSQVNLPKKIQNVFIIFILSGFWHGANWTFIIWGALNAIYFLPSLLNNKNRIYLDTVAKGKYFPNIKEIFNMFTTFLIVVFAWVFFRSENISCAFKYFSIIFSKSFFSIPQFDGKKDAFTIIIFIVFFMSIEWINREKSHPMAEMHQAVSRNARWSIYLSLTLLIYFFGNFSESIEFIYFQF